MVRSTPTEPRLAISMWDFSWLVRRAGDEAEYADWDRVLDELCERGYNCVRIDAFPHLIAAARAPDDAFHMRPQSPRFMWGNHQRVTITPRRALIDFIRKAKARHVKVALSAWYGDDDTHQRYTLRTVDDFARAWSTTLAMIAEHGLADAIAWVDLCNEFPLPFWMPSAYERIYATSRRNLLPLILPLDARARARAQTFIDDAIAQVRAAHPCHAYTFSSQSIGRASLDGLDNAAFDLLEPHVWLSDLPLFHFLSGHARFLLPFGDTAKNIARLSRRGRALYEFAPDYWRGKLDAHLATFAARARALGKPLVTSEGWTTVFYGEGGAWDWFQEISAFAVRRAIHHGWQGICTTNFSQPHFPSVWRDVAWHRALTHEITTATAATLAAHP
jgi:hypothetical protein